MLSLLLTTYGNQQTNKYINIKQKYIHQEKVANFNVSQSNSLHKNISCKLQNFQIFSFKNTWKTIFETTWDKFVEDENRSLLCICNILETAKCSS